MNDKWCSHINNGDRASMIKSATSNDIEVVSSVVTQIFVIPFSASFYLSDTSALPISRYCLRAAGEKIRICGSMFILGFLVFIKTAPN